MKPLPVLQRSRGQPSVAIRLIGLTRVQKRIISLAADVVMLVFAVWAAFAVRLGSLAGPETRFWWLFIAVPLVSIPIFAHFGLYRAVIRYLGSQAAAAVFKAVSLSALIWVLLCC